MSIPSHYDKDGAIGFGPFKDILNERMIRAGMTSFFEYDLLNRSPTPLLRYFTIFCGDVIDGISLVYSTLSIPRTFEGNYTMYFEGSQESHSFIFHESTQRISCSSVYTGLLSYKLDPNNSNSIHLFHEEKNYVGQVEIHLLNDSKGEKIHEKQVAGVTFLTGSIQLPALGAVDIYAWRETITSGPLRTEATEFELKSSDNPGGGKYTVVLNKNERITEIQSVRNPRYHGHQVVQGLIFGTNQNRTMGPFGKFLLEGPNVFERIKVSGYHILFRGNSLMNYLRFLEVYSTSFWKQRKWFILLWQLHFQQRCKPKSIFAVPSEIFQSYQQPGGKIQFPSIQQFYQAIQKVPVKMLNDFHMQQLMLRCFVILPQDVLQHMVTFL